MVRLSALLMACFLVGSPIANAQECMDKLVAALQKVSDQCNPEKHSTCHISYRLEQQQQLCCGSIQFQRVYRSGNGHCYHALWHHA